jgi:hypothetical protein
VLFVRWVHASSNGPTVSVPAKYDRGAATKLLGTFMNRNARVKAIGLASHGDIQSR